jgi:hypothetical protein
MTEAKNLKRHDLEDRTLGFAIEVLKFAGILPKTMATIKEKGIID